jgi:malate permease and related proteins
MNNYLMLGACFLLGIILRRSGRLPDNAAVTLNGFVVNISLPALTLAYVHDLDFNSRLILPALMPWIMFGLGCAFFWLLGRALNFSPATTGGLMLTGGLADRRSIVAIDHELDPPLLTLMIGVGIPLSFLTLPAWWYLLSLV